MSERTYKPKKYDKIVRDKIVDRILDSGAGVVAKIAPDDSTTIEYLLKKLQEEIKEYKNPGQDDYDPDELVDILEVVLALATVHGIDHFDFAINAKRKRESHGSFEKRIILKETL